MTGALIATGVVACGGDNSGTGACTLIGYDLVVELVDPADARVSAAGLTYRIDGGSARAARCDPEGFLGRCVLDEVPGVYELVASKAGYRTATAVRTGVKTTGPNGPGCGDIVVFIEGRTKLVLEPL